MHILLTRPLEDSKDLILKFKSLGHQVSHLPVINIEKKDYEEPNYNETYTISWQSNASQCYAQSATGSWLGELDSSGSQDFIAKREGVANYGIQCRTSIDFASASIDVQVQKDFIDYFDFILFIRNSFYNFFCSGLRNSYIF